MAEKSRAWFSFDLVPSVETQLLFACHLIILMHLMQLIFCNLNVIWTSKTANVDSVEVKAGSTCTDKMHIKILQADSDM